MKDTTSKGTPSPIGSWRFPMIIGLSVGIAIPASQGVEQAMTETVGPWPAMAIGLIAAAAIGAAVAIIVGLLLRRFYPETRTTLRNGDSIA